MNTAQSAKSDGIVKTLALVLTCCLTWSSGVLAADCNGNGTDDTRDIESATSDDCNENGVPDECDVVLPAFDVRPESLPVASFPRVVGSGDLDGDGQVDLVTGNRNTDPDRTSTLSLLLNRGGGEYAPSIELDAGAHLCHLTVCDLDQDGDLDVASANVDRILVFINDGAADFREPASHPVGDGARLVVAGDIDGDGDADLVTANSASRAVALLRNDGSGTFASPESLDVGDYPTAVALADLDDDGYLDLATTTRDSTSVTVLVNEGGTEAPFGATRREHDIGAGAAHSLIAGDFTGDGISDLVVGTPTSVSLLVNDGSGALDPPLPLSLTGSSNSLEAGDFDGDGDTDLAVGFVAPRKVSLALNDGTGTFLVLDAISLVRALRPGSLLVEDLDGDGDADLGLLTFNSSAAQLYRHVESRTTSLAFEAAQKFPAGGRPHTTDLGDLDGDGDLDLIIARNHDGGISVLHGLGDGTLGEPTLQGGNVITFAVRLGDFDSDGDLDLATVDQDSGRLQVLANGGNANFIRGSAYTVGNNPFHITATDIDGDENLDLIVSNRASHNITPLMGVGDGTFERRESIRLGIGPVATAAADFDGDGDNDLAVAHQVSSDVRVLRNLGAGSFAEPEIYPVTGTPSFIVAGDLSDDGRVDLIVANENGTISILWNEGDGTFDENIRSLPTGHRPYSVFLADVDGDGKSDVGTASELDGSVSFLLSSGNFLQPVVQQVGRGPRFAAMGDLDGDGDLDLVSGNRGDDDVSVLLNVTGGGEAGFLERVCTEVDFHTLSVPPTGASAGERGTKYILPARDDATLLPTLFQNVRRYALHEEFLREAFPERFGALTGEEYARLVGRRESRDYFAGALRRVREESGFIYVFTVVADTGFDPGEVLHLEDVQRVYETLRGAFELEPLYYHPEGELARREVAENWPEPPPVPIYSGTGRPDFDYEAYSLAVGYGRVRVLTLAELEEVDRSGGLTFEDIAVVDQAPGDIEGVVGGLITGEPQAPLSPTALRLAHQAAPAVYVADALEVFGRYDGQLVRLEVCETGYTVDDDVTLAEAESFWANGLEVPALPPFDADYAGLDSLAELAPGAGGVPPEGRFGGKASNLARLGGILTGDLESYRESGFAIPMRYYFEFLRTNTVTIEGRELTYEEHLAELLAASEFRSDSRRRAEALESFRALLRDESVVDPELVQRLAERIVEVFGSTSRRVRFRSSSNIEDALEWGGARLDASTAACAADTLDAEEPDSSHCDSTGSDERTIERALKDVWASLWTFRAFEARTHFQIPQASAAMGVLVRPAVLNASAGGVAFTGDPANPEDRRYLVAVQVGEESVLSPAPGVTIELNRLEWVDGEVRIFRERSSSLVTPGETVLSDDQLRELGNLLAHVDENFPLGVEDPAREDVIFELEFKVEPGGSLAVEQVRPFLPPTSTPRHPIFELEIPAGTEVCGVYTGQRVGREPRTEYETKSTLRFVAGTHELPAGSTEFSAELIEEARFGPGAELATPDGPGVFRVIRLPRDCNRTTYRFNYEQRFTLPGGEDFAVKVFGLQLTGQGDRALERHVIDAESATFDLVMEGELAGEPVVSYASCGHGLLPLWSTEIELEGGSHIRLEERFLPSEDNISTGPASLVRAAVSLEGQRQTVTDYLRLVYAARRHNRNVRYWAVLDPPLELESVVERVRVVEVAAPEALDGSPARVRYLGEDFAVLSEPEVIRYERTQGRIETSFVRADVDGTETVNVADALALLRFLFQRGTQPDCLKAADTNDDGRLNVNDAIGIIRLLFGDRGPLPEPSVCGMDPTVDPLSCERSTCQ